MTEKQYSPTDKEKKLNERKVGGKSIKPDKKSDNMTEAVNIATKEVNERKEEKKKKPEKVEIKPKEKAIVNGTSLPLSFKHCKWICRMIKGKSPERAVEMLGEVVREKRAVPMPTLEVGHQKGKGMAGGRFPKNASLGIIELLKQVNANAVVSGVENPVIVIAKANEASKPFRRNRRKAKRCHVYVEVKDRTKLKK